MDCFHNNAICTWYAPGGTVNFKAIFYKCAQLKYTIKKKITAANLPCYNLFGMQVSALFCYTGNICRCSVLDKETTFSERQTDMFGHS